MRPLRSFLSFQDPPVASRRLASLAPASASLLPAAEPDFNPSNQPPHPTPVAVGEPGSPGGRRASPPRYIPNERRGRALPVPPATEYGNPRVFMAL